MVSITEATIAIAVVPPTFLSAASLSFSIAITTAELSGVKLTICSETEAQLQAIQAGLIANLIILPPATFSLPSDARLSRHVERHLKSEAEGRYWHMVQVRKEARGMVYLRGEGVFYGSVRECGSGAK